ncbi:tyrosine--tRNA ligase [Thermoflexibacter ruber]|uniref:Tyrosine--tRNA ligase n=1 Tax=Thermoflexibacter ruber TaxID=1003 RepID=A0A1I2G2J3_9BACT|nr:tyrosine--tRNA ligase [Thermoflexibacter ruber]SFF11349.1 tyrosyl-tRNA synthetase [Thermoflexibacter ruber]
MKNFVEELKWRGMLHDMTPGTEAQLNKEMTAGYIGFDPTASSLHIGNLATIMLLVHLQRTGHKPFALVGGATGMIGDPSGKSEERKFLDEEVLKHNQTCIKKQLEKFLDFDSGANSAEMVNNYDWFKEIGFLQFLREVGKHLTINYMISKDSVQKRLETGISFTEFSYQLLQGYDFYWLYKNKNIKLQMGGSDQWGNITTGTELIRRKESGEAFALTTPLLTRSDGQKFGKSEGGNVWLDANMTSPYKFYQFWLNVADDDLPKLLRVFTLWDRETIEAFDKEADKNKVKRELAKDLTTRIHSESDYQQALKASELLFKGTLADFNATEERILNEIFEGVPQIEISQSEYKNTSSIVDFLSVVTQNQIFTSKGEARRMLKEGGVSINKEKVSEATSMQFEFLKGKYLLVQKGKKNYFWVKIG